MKRPLLYTLGMMTILSSLTACDDYLAKDPSKNSNKPISEISQLDALLASYKSYYSEYNTTFLATDDYGLTTEIEDNLTSNTSIDDLNEFTWAPVNRRNGWVLWDGEYSKIFRANLVISNINEVSGSEDEKADLKAEAHLLRAYSLFQLAISHCLYPSPENSGELGLPLRATTSFEEPVARESLGATFSFIENDILEAIKISRPFVNGAGTIMNYRGTTASAKALAARYYLYMGDYEKASRYAGEVLAEYNTLKDFNDPAEMYYSSNVETFTLYPGTPEEKKITCKFPYTYVQFWGASGFPELMGWKELLYARVSNYSSWRYIPSADLLDTFARDIKDNNPDNDLRYHYFVIKDLGLRYSVSTDAGRFDGYSQFYLDNLISGPTVAEMMLIKAECLARSGNTTEAISLVNNLRKARIATDAYEDLSIGSPAEVLKKVLDERRREMPLTIRWYDLKRYAWNDDPSDDVTITRHFYPYTNTTVLMNDAVQTHILEP